MGMVQLFLGPLPPLTVPILRLQWKKLSNYFGGVNSYMKLTRYIIIRPHICNRYMHFTFDVQAPSDVGMFTLEIGQNCSIVAIACITEAHC